MIGPCVPPRRPSARVIDLPVRVTAGSGSGSTLGPGKDEDDKLDWICLRRPAVDDSHGADVRATAVYEDGPQHRSEEVALRWVAR